ncbi:hypothetical protein [Actinomadura decatromicini]|uniref:hypothetical protein n=1 Tax=Actinomadura decatromicini TaxID=2604572 RepID=UPI001652DD9D|nr:hypothetical protein [Actinomadura decatromicini]
MKIQLLNCLIAGAGVGLLFGWISRSYVLPLAIAECFGASIAYFQDARKVEKDGGGLPKNFSVAFGLSLLVLGVIGIALLAQTTS